jgi:hypothetical protein
VVAGVKVKLGEGDRLLTINIEKMGDKTSKLIAP